MPISNETKKIHEVSVLVVGKKTSGVSIKANHGLNSDTRTSVL